MSHIKSYKMIEAGSSRALMIYVNSDLDEGWELHGPTQVICTKEKSEGWDYADITFYQAMVKLKVQP